MTEPRCTEWGPRVLGHDQACVCMYPTGHPGPHGCGNGHVSWPTADLQWRCDECDARDEDGYRDGLRWLCRDCAHTLTDDTTGATA